MITIQELLINRGLPKDAKIKLLRHKDGRKVLYKGKKIDLRTLYRTDIQEFLNYQSAQGEPRFHNVDYVVSFLGEDKSTARFVGVYKVLAELPMDDLHRTNPEDNYYYPMEKMSGFEDIEEHVIVKWAAPLSWHQWFDKEKEMVEWSPGMNYREFTTYLDFVITFDELKEIMDNEYPDWKRMLSNVYGVYVICDRSTGELYIGSAYNRKGGIWDRWKEYSQNGHGGDKKLIEKLKDNPNYAKNYTFSILTIMSKKSSNQEVLDQEKLFKDKFDSINHGLNDN